MIDAGNSTLKKRSLYGLCAWFRCLITRRSQLVMSVSALATAAALDLSPRTLEGHTAGRANGSSRPTPAGKIARIGYLQSQVEGRTPWRNELYVDVIVVR